MNQSDNTKVSVIIPTYNRAALLPRAVNSVLAQTYDNYEIIIVDDCSPDNTQEVIDGFTDSRIHSFRHERNKGQSAARNTGIANAAGEYIAFLDDDDEWLPNKLEIQVDTLDASASNVALIYCWSNWIDDSSGRVMTPRHSYEEGDIFEQALAMNAHHSPPTLLVRTSVLREVGGFDEDMDTHEDRVLLCKIAQRYCVTVVPQVLVYVHTSHGHSQSTSATKEKLENRAKNTKAFVETFIDELNERPKVFAKVLHRLAIDEMMSSHPRAALKSYSAAFSLNPLSRDTFTRVPLLFKIFVWYATPLSRLRLRTKSILRRWNPIK